MKILQVHNFYQNPGGEDQVFAAEYDLLTSHGHKVIRYEADNARITQISGMTAALDTFWNQETYRSIRRLLRQERPEVVHSHNTFPLISPSLYYAAARERVPVVQTLHNYRLICPGANLFRGGHICQQCVGSVLPYRAVLHRCYRNSTAASTVTAAMLAAHRAAGTWKNNVHTYIAMSAFAKSKFVEGGLPSEHIAIKPNFLPSDPGAGPGDGDYLLFAGRLTEEKGISTLIDAWQQVHTDLRLKIAGQGPLSETCRQRTDRNASFEFLGQLTRPDLLAAMQRAQLLIFPSRYPDPGPLTILEAFACGTPVLACDMQSMDAYVKEGENGFRFRAGDAGDLANKIQQLVARPDLLQRSRRAARASYENDYTAAHNYDQLITIYNRALNRKPI
jgi:glycosyltransferase involved in cell wall biosynthesis